MEALNHKLVLKKVPRVIKFNQNAWLRFFQTDELTNKNYGKC